MLPVAKLKDGLRVFGEVDAIRADGPPHLEHPIRHVVRRAAVVEGEGALFFHNTGREKVGVIEGTRLTQRDDGAIGVVDPHLFKEGGGEGVGGEN